MTTTPPQGAVYIWAKIPGGDDARYISEALEHAHVSLAAGSFYGEQGRGYIRISLTTPVERLTEAFMRLHHWHMTS